MKASLITRIASLLLVLALLVPGTSAAKGTSAYVRAVSKGRVAIHRPNYRQYNTNHNRWFFQRW